MNNLDKIKEHVNEEREIAEGILSGERDNYDGADGARYMLDMCNLVDRLIEMIEAK